MRNLYCILNNKLLKGISLVALDVDGVLTDGNIYYGQNGEFIKGFNVKDGLGIKMLQRYEIKVAFISGGKGGATEIRAKQLDISHCIVESKNKRESLINLQKSLGILPRATLFLGDDINDLVVRDRVAILASTADASKSLKAFSNIILKKKGGNGAIRELAEEILISKRIWNTLKRNGWNDRND